MSDKKYVSIFDVDANNDYMTLPKAFINMSCYREMSVDSKFIYIVLLDRAKLSFQNDWFDEEGRVYFIFKNDDLRFITNIPSKQRLIKAKKELIDKNLLEQKRFGQGKPNRLYLLYPLSEIELQQLDSTRLGEEFNGEKLLYN
ncbi:replication initiator protein A [Staphylococcus aureus]|uniref:replication initiator protein A n=1 Tax=Staphylococcus aureus TaxID=1280 RepID=UPI002114C1F3|nr:replication initiator protein A [Staphylococcus aureus]